MTSSKIERAAVMAALAIHAALLSLRVAPVAPAPEKPPRPLRVTVVEGVGSVPPVPRAAVPESRREPAPDPVPELRHEPSPPPVRWASPWPKPPPKPQPEPAADAEPALETPPEPPRSQEAWETHPALDPQPISFEGPGVDPVPEVQPGPVPNAQGNPVTATAVADPGLLRLSEPDPPPGAPDALVSEPVAERAVAGGPVEVPAAFLSQVSTWLERQRSYPVAARRLGQEGEVLVRLRLDGFGRAVEAALVGTTGHRLLDEAVLRMVEKAQPFPPPPIPMGKTLECLVPVRFRLRP